MTLYILLYALFHIACGVLSYGLLFAHFQRAFPRLADRDHTKDKVSSALAAITGPVALIATLVLLAGTCRGRPGLKFK
jgi:hypothetical protein